MKKEDLRIVYMGTPDFAVESLRALVEGGYNVVGVITMPDKPMGRHGSVLQPSAVKQYAVSVGLPVLQPEKLKDEAFWRNCVPCGRICRSWWRFVCCRRWSGICPVWELLICMPPCFRNTGVPLRSTGRLSMVIRRPA